MKKKYRTITVENIKYGWTITECEYSNILKIWLNKKPIYEKEIESKEQITPNLVYYIIKNIDRIKFNENIYNIVYKYQTKYKQGFIRSEIQEILDMFPNINKSKFDDALFGITAMIIDNNMIIYHCDIEKALHCGLENRELRSYEWD